MADCAICSRPVADTAWACTTCGQQATARLDAIADLAEPARDVAHGQARRGPAVAGSNGGGLPINLSATARLDATANTLIGWVRIVSTDKGGGLQLTGEPIADAARYLATHTGWMRYQQWAAEAFADFDAGARVLRGLIDGRPGRRYLGPCDSDGCAADLYAPYGASRATCRTCGTDHDVADRRDWLDQLARDHAYTATEIQEAYGIPAGRIRVWAHRTRIVATGTTAEGWPVYPLGQVLDLAAADAARRATQQAKRARQRDTDDVTEGAA